MLQGRRRERGRGANEGQKARESSTRFSLGKTHRETEIVTLLCIYVHGRREMVYRWKMYGRKKGRGARRAWLARAPRGVGAAHEILSYRARTIYVYAISIGLHRLTCPPMARPSETERRRVHRPSYATHTPLINKFHNCSAVSLSRKRRK